MKNGSVTGESVGLGAAVRRYFGLLVVLLRREEEIRRHSPLETLLNLAEPVLWIGLLTSAWYFLERMRLPPVGSSPVLFFASGLVAKFFFIYISRRMGGGVARANVRFPIERRLDHIIVQIVIRSVDFVILGLAVFGTIYIFFTDDAAPYDLIPIVKAFVLVVMLGAGWGIINFVVTGWFWPWGYVAPLVNRGLIIFSGIFFIPDFMSPGARDLLSFNPMVHAIILFRQGFYRNFPSLLLDMDYLIACSVFLLFLGLMLERVSRRGEQR